MIHDELTNAYKAGDTSTEELLLAAYERAVLAQGSFKNGERQVENVSLAFHGDTTRKTFDEIFTGRASANSGFLARCKLCFAWKQRVHEWAPMDIGKAQAAIQKLLTAISELPKSRIGGNVPFVPQETAEATKLREEFFTWLDGQNEAFTAELDAHFRRDVLVRVIASASKIIEANHIKAAAAWTKYQLALREALYPADHEDVIGQLSSKILKLLDKDPTHTWTDRDFNRRLHLNIRNHGTSEQYVRARSSLIKSGAVRAYGMNRRGGEMYQRTEPSARVAVAEEDKNRLQEISGQKGRGNEAMKTQEDGTSRMVRGTGRPTRRVPRGRKEENAN
jgi:hypothetical protein